MCRQYVLPSARRPGLGAYVSSDAMWHPRDKHSVKPPRFSGVWCGVDCVSRCPYLARSTQLGMAEDDLLVLFRRPLPRATSANECYEELLYNNPALEAGVMLSMQLAPHDKPSPLRYTRAGQVWYLSPADDDCIGVLRYHVVPHPVLAPTVSSPCPPYHPPHVPSGEMTPLSIWFCI